MHSTGVPIKKNNKVCKYDPCLNSGKYGRLHCSQLFTSFPCGAIIHLCPVEFRSSMACALGNEMLIEVMCVISKEKLYEPIWESPCFSLLFAVRLAALLMGTAPSERVTKWGCYEQSHKRLTWTLVWGIKHMVLWTTEILKSLLTLCLSRII